MQTKNIPFKDISINLFASKQMNHFNLKCSIFLCPFVYTKQQYQFDSLCSDRELDGILTEFKSIAFQIEEANCTEWKAFNENASWN